MIKTRILFLFACSLLLVSCKNVETKPVKNNVLKEYINTPLDKTRDIKSRVESKQEEARKQLLLDDE